jgi:hypothetical protein
MLKPPTWARVRQPAQASASTLISAQACLIAGRCRWMSYEHCVCTRYLLPSSSESPNACGLGRALLIFGVDPDTAALSLVPGESVDEWRR